MCMHMCVHACMFVFTPRVLITWNEYTDKVVVQLFDFFIMHTINKINGHGFGNIAHLEFLPKKTKLIPY